MAVTVKFVSGEERDCDGDSASLVDAFIVIDKTIGRISGLLWIT